MPDFAPWQDAEYRDLHYDRADPTLAADYRVPIDDATRAAVRAAVDDLKITCPDCGGKLWNAADLKVHRERRHA